MIFLLERTGSLLVRFLFILSRASFRVASGFIVMIFFVAMSLAVIVFRSLHFFLVIAHTMSFSVTIPFSSFPSFRITEPTRFFTIVRAVSYSDDSGFK